METLFSTITVICAIAGVLSGVWLGSRLSQQRPIRPRRQDSTDDEIEMLRRLGSADDDLADDVGEDERI